MIISENYRRATARAIEILNKRELYNVADPFEVYMKRVIRDDDAGKIHQTTHDSFPKDNRSWSDTEDFWNGYMSVYGKMGEIFGVIEASSYCPGVSTFRMATSYADQVDRNLDYVQSNPEWRRPYTVQVKSFTHGGPDGFNFHPSWVYMPKITSGEPDVMRPYTDRLQVVGPLRDDMTIGIWTVDVSLLRQMADRRIIPNVSNTLELTQQLIESFAKSSSSTYHYSVLDLS